MRKIYYHTFESGAQLKRIEQRLPPRSLYTELPRRFCFRPTTELPAFLGGERAEYVSQHEGLELFALSL